jgi:hypothetical protein
MLPLKVALKGLFVRKIDVLAIMVLASLLMTACAGSPTRNSMLLNRGVMSYERSADSGYDFVVRIQNLKDPPFWDGNSREDREKTVATLFEKECTKSEIVSEIPTQIGTYAFGVPAILWTMKIKCVK